MRHTPCRPQGSCGRLETTLAREGHRSGGPGGPWDRPKSNRNPSGVSDLSTQPRFESLFARRRPHIYLPGTRRQRCPRDADCRTTTRPASSGFRASFVLERQKEDFGRIDKVVLSLLRGMEKDGNICKYCDLTHGISPADLLRWMWR